MPQEFVTPQYTNQEAALDHDDDDVLGEHYEQPDLEDESQRVVSAEQVLKRSGWYKEVHAGHNEPPFSAAPLQGNIYRYWAITWPGKSSASCAFSCCMLRSWAGLVAVMMVQILGPIAMLYSAMYELDFSSCSFVVIGTYSKEQGLTKILARLLSTLLLYGFIAKSYNSLSEEVLADKKMHVLFIRMYRMNAFVFHRSWIVIGAAINCWVSVLSCIAMWFIFQDADSPTDVLFDALSLTFLVNLDNVSGEMGVISERHWNESWIGVFWHDLVRTPVLRAQKMPLTFSVDAVRDQMTLGRPRDLDHIIQSEKFVDNVLECQEEYLDEAADMEDEFEDEASHIFNALQRRASSYRCLSCIYSSSKCVLMILLLILPISFIFVSLKENNDD